MRVKTIFKFINIEQLNEFHYIILFKCFGLESTKLNSPISIKFI